jgi:hypothetical protein
VEQYLVVKKALNVDQLMVLQLLLQTIMQYYSAFPKQFVVDLITCDRSSQGNIKADHVFVGESGLELLQWSDPKINDLKKLVYYYMLIKGIIKTSS